MEEKTLTDAEIAARQRADSLAEEDKYEIETRRAEEAKRVLENPLVQEAFANLEEVYMHALRYSPVDRSELREAARWRLEALELFRGELQHILDTGTIAVQRRQTEDELGNWLAEERRENG